MAAAEVKYAKLLAWLEENGAEISPDIKLVALSPNSDYRGVRAIRPIPAQTVIISIPLPCLITDLMGRNETELGRLVFHGARAPNLSAPALISVVLFILEHQRMREQSFFHAYLDCLPTDWSNFPVFWPERDLHKWLAGSPLVEDVEERLQTMRADYEEIARLVGGEDGKFDYSWDEFLRARTCVGSRNFGIQVDGKKRTSMVPFADMLNHLRPRQTSWTFEAMREHFTVTALGRGIDAGCEVMDSYGKKDNARFLLHYGFAVEGNREEDGKCPNELELELECEQDLLFPIKLALLGGGGSDGGVESRFFRISMHREDKETAQAISHCRLLVASEDEVMRLSNVTMGEFLGMKNEMAALRCLARACGKQLLEYEHTFEENLARLREMMVHGGGAERSALIVLVGEQEICSYWIYAVERLTSAYEERGVDGLKSIRARESDAPLPAWSREYWEADCAKHATWLRAALADSERRKQTTRANFGFQNEDLST